MNINKRDELIIRAAIEFSPDPFYEIRNGTLGLTLYAEVETQSAANEIRKKIPTMWEGLYCIVLYNRSREDELSALYDTKLTWENHEELEW